MRLIRLLKRDLAKETTHWVAEDLINEDQAKAICQRYNVDYDSAHSHNNGYRLLMNLGYLFIGLALITLIGANWEDIPREWRMGGLVALTLGTQALALWRYAQGEVASASGLFLLGNLFYGASIILIAQIYHLGEHMPDGIFWWALGSLPFGLLLHHAYLTLFSCVLALIWFWVEYNLGFYPYLFPLFILAGVYVLYRSPKTSALLFLAVLISVVLWIETLLSVLWADRPYQYEIYIEHFLASAALFLFAYALSHWLHSQKNLKAQDYGVLLALWTLRFAFVAMLVLSYEYPWQILLEAEWPHQQSLWAIFGGLLCAAFLLAWRGGILPLFTPIALFVLGSMIAVMQFDHVVTALQMQVVYNIALIAAGIGLIVQGMNSGVSHFFFLGVTTILLTALMRYIDLVGDYIGGALLFLAMAALLLGSAKFWRHRQSPEVRA